MEEINEAVAAKANQDSTITPPSSSSDPLHTLLPNLQGCELQGANSECDILETMNLRVASEHDRGVRVFVERLKQKNDRLSECMQEIDYEVTEVESTLDKHARNLESKIRVPCSSCS